MSVATVQLGELCDILSGFAWSASKFNRDGRGVPIIRIQNVDAVSDNDFVYWDDSYDERFVIRQGDLLLTLSGSFRIESWSGPNALLNQRIIKLTPSPKLDRGWLLHVLRPRLGQIERLGKHALVNNVSLRDIRNLVIPLPPLAEQRRIAEVLDQAEALRAKRRAVLAQLDSLNHSLFLDLFGDPATNPKGWPRKSIGEIGTVITGNTPPRANPENYGRDIEWIKSDNINTPHYYLTKADERLSRVGRAIARTAPQDSILVTCIAGSPTCIGNAAMTDREVAFNQQINALMPRLSDAHFLYGQLRVGKRLIQEASTGGMKGMVSKSRFEAIMLLVPPLSLQREFARRVRVVETLKTAQLASLAELDALFATLQHRAFRGEL